MIVLRGRNVQPIFPEAIRFVLERGYQRLSRNGPVLLSPEPVTTVYERPIERVLFWPERDANPFFHFYEALWMLAGRNDLKTLGSYSTRIASFSDDGSTLYGAYGYRWRHAFRRLSTEPIDPGRTLDQLAEIIAALREDMNDRRCVLQMWHAPYDLGHRGKDVPCNLTATFQRDPVGRLDLTVFNRSNDIVWGAYGANVVHMSMLQEYVARGIGCEMGVYRQVSVNWHAYLDTLEPVKSLAGKEDQRYDGAKIDITSREDNAPKFLFAHRVFPLPMPSTITDDVLLRLLVSEQLDEIQLGARYESGSWAHMARQLLYAHVCWRRLAPPERFTEALRVLDEFDAVRKNIDWIVAAKEWITRRYSAWEAKMSRGATVN